MATEIAKAYVQIVPSAQGITGSITSALASESQSAGITSGTTIGNGVLSSLKGVLGVASVTAAISGVVKALGSCVSEASDFDAAMSQVAATMGTTTDEISDLTDFAKEMGRTTAFSAQEAAEGLNTLAMSGLDAEEQMEVLPAVMNLASAGCLSLDSAASYVTGAIKGFGSSMDDATYYTDLMAKGATLANTDVNDLGEALSGSAATAASYGQQADSVTLSLLRLAEQNVTGSEATTALNRAMADLYTPTDAAKQALTELGVACYDAEGNARDFNDITDELAIALAGYDEETQNAYKDTIFTTQGLSAFNKMTASSSETVDGFREALAECEGSAMQQADTQLDNLQGDVTLFKSAMSGLKTEVGEALTPALRNITQFATKGVTAFTNLISGQVDWKDSFHDCVDKIKEKIGITDWDGMGEDIHSGIGGGLSTLINEAPGKISEFVQTIDQKIKDFDWHEAGYNLADTILTGISSIKEEIGGKISSVTEEIKNCLSNIDWENVGYNMMTAVLNGIKMIVVDVPQAIAQFTQSIIQRIREVDWLELGKEIVQGIINGITNFIPNAIQGIGSFCSGIFSAFKDFFQTGSPSKVMMEQGEFVADGVIEGLSNKEQEAADTSTGIGQTIMDCFRTGSDSKWGDVDSFYTEKKESILSRFDDYDSEFNRIGETFQQVRTGVGNVWDTVSQQFDTKKADIIAKFDDFESRFTDIGERFRELKTGVSNVWSIVSQWYSDKKSAIIAKFDDFKTKFTTIGERFNGLKTGVSNVWAAVSQTYSDKKSAILEKFDNFRERFTTIGERFSGLKTGVNNKWPELSTRLSDLKSDILSKFDGIKEDFKSVGNRICDGVREGISNGWGALSSYVAQKARSLLDSAKAAIGVSSPSKAFRDEVGAMIPAGIAAGVERNAEIAEDAVTDMMTATLDSANTGLSAINDALESGISGYSTALDMSSLPGTMVSVNPADETGYDAQSDGTAQHNIDQLYELLEQYLPLLANMQVMLDGDTVVGELAPLIDRQMGRLNMQRARGLT